MTIDEAINILTQHKWSVEKVNEQPARYEIVMPSGKVYLYMADEPSVIHIAEQLNGTSTGSRVKR